MAQVSDIYSHKLELAQVIAIIASLEKGSSHVLANAFIQKAAEMNLELKEITDFESLSGLGIRGTIDNVEYAVGNLRMMKESGIDLSRYQEKIDL